MRWYDVQALDSTGIAGVTPTGSMGMGPKNGRNSSM